MSQPPVLPDHPPAAATAKPPFAVQAAQFAFWAPIVAIIIGCAANSALNQPRDVSSSSGAASLVIGVFSLVILAASLVLGTIALIGARKQKIKGVVTRSIIGMTLS